VVKLEGLEPPVPAVLEYQLVSVVASVFGVAVFE
jgi:hypothetical protein